MLKRHFSTLPSAGRVFGSVVDGDEYITTKWISGVKYTWGRCKHVRSEVLLLRRVGSWGDTVKEEAR